MNKLVLGTTQFGIDYGINNKRGKIPQEEAFQIIEKALCAGINIFDTAYNYGESEKILGKFISSHSSPLNIISKLPKCSHSEVRGFVESSLANLGIPEIYGYLVHNFESYLLDRGIWEELQKLKGVGKIKNIGFSVYYPGELEMVLGVGPAPDIVEMPFSVFDQRFRTDLAELKKRNIQIYARSVFLQGLVFKDPSELPPGFSPIKEKIEKLNRLSAKLGIPAFALYLNFVLMNEQFDKVVIGIDSLMHFDEVTKVLDYSDKVRGLMQMLSDLKVENEDIVVPMNWEKHGIRASWLK